MGHTLPLKKQLTESAQPLLQAWPLDKAFRCDERSADADREIADKAVEGILVSVYNGIHERTIGRTNIDWDAVMRGDEGYRQLSRQPMLPSVMKAWYQTEDERYSEAAIDYIRDYARAFDAVPEGSNSLDLGIRSANTARILHLLATTQAGDEEFLQTAVDYLERELNWLVDNLSTGINWRVHNTRDLLIAALYLRFLPDAEHWADTAVAALNDAYFRQFLPDSVHYERNPVYHIGMASTFLQLYKLTDVLPELGLKMSLDRIEPMYNFVAALSRPNGYLCAIHDSQGDHSGHITTAKGQAAVAGHKSVNPLAIYRKFREEAGLPDQLPPTHQYFPDAGLAFFRTGWGEDDQYVTFDATRWGGGHCHLSRNAIQLHAHRRSMIVDPGWLAYNGDDWGKHGRSTRAHSTCTLNDLNQSSTNPSKTKTFSAPGYDCAFSVYEGGYWDTELSWNFTHAAKGIWGQHARTAFWVQNRFLIVADSLFRLPHTPGDPAEERPSVACNWQLSEDGDLDLAVDASRATVQWPEANLLMLFPIRPEGTTLTSHCGEEAPLRGWLPGEQERLPAPQLSLTAGRMEKQHDYFVSILIPTAGDQVPKVRVEAKSPLGTVGHVILHWEDGSRDEIHWGCGFEMRVGKGPDFETDSSLIHLARGVNGKVTGGCCVDGTYLTPFAPDERRQPETFVI
ncbi:MAG: heparinase II/III family protein [Planctomycetota bacterium]|jgi:hypothetical protein